MRPMKAHRPAVLGIPVVYDERMERISDTSGIGRWKRIKIGPSFWQLTPREAEAVLLHEAGHCKLYHLEQRLLWIWLALVSPRRLIEMCHEQEYAADRFAAAAGYGLDLVSLFTRMHEGNDTAVNFHPPLAARIERLMQAQGV